jgi:hypothetical protein
LWHDLSIPLVYSRHTTLSSGIVAHGTIERQQHLPRRSRTSRPSSGSRKPARDFADMAWRGEVQLSGSRVPGRLSLSTLTRGGGGLDGACHAWQPTTLMQCDSLLSWSCQAVSRIVRQTAADGALQFVGRKCEGASDLFMPSIYGLSPKISPDQVAGLTQAYRARTPTTAATDRVCRWAASPSMKVPRFRAARITSSSVNIGLGGRLRRRDAQ